MRNGGPLVVSFRLRLMGSMLAREEVFKREGSGKEDAKARGASEQMNEIRVVFKSLTGWQPVG